MTPKKIMMMLLLLALSGPAPALAQDKAQLAVINGKVITVDSNHRIAQAVAIRDGKIVAVGTNSEIQRWTGPQSQIIDAQGKTVIPGLIESHSHATGVAQGESTDPYEEMTSIAAVQDWVRRAASKKPAGEWIAIPRTFPTRLRERRLPTRAELDAASSRHPVVFDAAYSHVLNSLALEKAGIRRESPAPSVGEIVRDAAGQPTGLLRNARGVFSKFLPSPKISQADALKHLEQVHKIYISLGITSMVERAAGLDDYQLYQELRKQKRLLPRSRITLRLPGTTSADAERFIKALPFKPGEGDEWLAPCSLKITVDGGILAGTAYMRQPYGTQAMPLFNLTDPEYRGSLSLQPEAITDLISTGHRLGWQMSAHVTGDAGVDRVLDAVEAAGKVRPIEPARFNLIHAYFPNPTAAARAKKLGVVVDTQTAWYYKDADALQVALGPERIKHFIGVRDWLQAGVPVVANTDHMLGTDPNRSLNPFNPYLTMYVLVTRKTQGGAVIGPEQKVSREEALQMMTRNAAYMTFDEGKKGSIEVGKLGDLAILLDDYLTVPEDKIKDIRVDTTIIDGRIVYQRQ